MNADRMIDVLISHRDMRVKVMLPDNTTADVRTVVTDPATGTWTILLDHGPDEHAMDR